MNLQPHITARSVYIPSKLALSQPASTGKKPSYHIFFLTGNPGCISYYHTYLSLLADFLSQSSKHRVNIYGTSLYNFVDEPDSKGVVSLQEQIAHVESTLLKYAASQVEIEGRGEPAKVILIGHSLGSYIGLEVIRRLREQRKQIGEVGSVDVIGYIGLFATVTHLAESPSGKKFGVCHVPAQLERVVSDVGSGWVLDCHISLK